MNDVLSTLDPAPWRRFIEQLSAAIALLDDGPLLNLKNGWVAVLKQIQAENRDLVLPVPSQAATP